MKRRKNPISPFFDTSGKKISVLLSASVEKFGVSRMRDFFLQKQIGSIIYMLSHLGKKTWSLIHGLSRFLVWSCLVCTLSRLKSFIESGVPPIRLFLMIIMIPLKRCVAKEFFLIALLSNDARNNFLMSGSRLSIAKIRPLLFSAPRGRCCYLIFSSCNVKFPR